MNNLYWWAMLQKFPANGFNWVENISQFNEDFQKSYNGGSDEEYIIDIDVQCPEKLRFFYNDLPFLSKRMKTEKVGKLIAKLHDKKEFVINTRNLKSWISFKKSA